MPKSNETWKQTIKSMRVALVTVHCFRFRNESLLGRLQRFHRSFPIDFAVASFVYCSLDRTSKMMQTHGEQVNCTQSTTHRHGIEIGAHTRSRIGIVRSRCRQLQLDAWASIQRRYKFDYTIFARCVFDVDLCALTRCVRFYRFTLHVHVQCSQECASLRAKANWFN